MPCTCSALAVTSSVAADNWDIFSTILLLDSESPSTCRFTSSIWSIRSVILRFNISNVSDAATIFWFWLSTASTDSSTEETTSLAFSFSSLTILVICSVEFFVCSASCLICSATTANPRPASPALALSIDAFSARRFVWLEIFKIIPAISSTSFVLFWSFVMAVVTSWFVFVISSDCVLNSSITRIFSWILSLEFIAISTICFELSPVTPIASWMELVIVLCSSMLPAVVLAEAEISCMLFVTDSVTPTSFSISSLLFTDSVWIDCEILSTPSKIRFSFSCSAAIEPSASSLNIIVIYPTLLMIKRIPRTPQILQIVSTSITMYPLSACTMVTIMYKILSPISVNFNPFLS